MSDNQRQHADVVRTIERAIEERASREGLWYMVLADVDFEALAYEIAEALQLIDGQDT